MLHRFYCFCKLIYSSLFRQMHETFCLVIYVPKHMDHISAMHYTDIYIYGFHGGPHWSCWEYRMSQIARISLGCSVENIECPKSLGFPWVVQFITHGHPFSLKASFESELGPLVINKFHINAHDDGLDP
jgi:hypothetical protein